MSARAKAILFAALTAVCFILAGILLSSAARAESRQRELAQISE